MVNTCSTQSRKEAPPRRYPASGPEQGKAVQACLGAVNLLRWRTSKGRSHRLVVAATPPMSRTAAAEVQKLCTCGLVAPYAQMERPLWEERRRVLCRLGLVVASGQRQDCPSWQLGLVVAWGHRQKFFPSGSAGIRCAGAPAGISTGFGGRARHGWSG